MGYKNSWELIHYLEEFEFLDFKSEEELLNLFEGNKNTKNELLISEIIDCLSINEVFHENVKLFVFDSLKNKTHYLVKLSCLGYLFNNSNSFGKDEIINLLNSCLSKRNLLLVKNQIILNLIYLDTNNFSYYFEQLLSSLRKTIDYRSHIRLYNLLTTCKNENVTKDKLMQMVEITKQFNFGKSVQSIINLLN
ncbi:MAG: hypothetical protein V4622_12715 [Bacteroidota bacterium]